MNLTQFLKALETELNDPTFSFSSRQNNTNFDKN